MNVVTSRQFNQFPNRILKPGEYTITKHSLPVYKIVVTIIAQEGPVKPNVVTIDYGLWCKKPACVNRALSSGLCPKHT